MTAQQAAADQRFEAQRQEDRAFQARLIEQMGRTMGSRPPKEYERPPQYACTTLQENATSVETDDWIRAVKEANDMRTTAEDHQKISWSSTKLCASLQTQWRAHAESLANPKWEDFTAFLQKWHVDPGWREIELRDSLMELRQLAEQSPMDHFNAWRAIHTSLGTAHTEDDPVLAHQYYFGLQPQVKKEIRKIRIDILQARELAQEAHRL